MISMIITVIMVTTSINFLYLKRINKYIENNIRSYNNEILKHAGDNLSFLLKQIEITEKQLIAISITFDSYINYDKENKEEMVAGVKQVENMLINLKRSLSGQYDLFLVNRDKNIFTSESKCDKNSLLKKEWIKNFDELNEGSITLLPHYANYYYIGNKSGYKKVMSFIRKIKSLSEENASVLMQVDIDYDEIKNICEDIKISDNGYIFLVDENGSIIYSRYDGDIAKNINDIDLTGPDNTDIKFNTENISGSFIVLEHEISDREWKLISLIPKESVKLWYKESRDLFFVISILSLSTCFIIAYFVSMGITKPIEKIVKTMGLVGEGKFITVSGETKNRELQVLVDSFNKMTGEIDSLMKSVIDKEREKSRAEIKALQAQINPHFLYNTLDSIKWMAILKSDHNVIAKSIASLGKLLKHSCKDSDSLIKIGDELSFLDNYIFIQKMRFGEKICVEYSIDNELFEYYTLKFILQPIVEKRHNPRNFIKRRWWAHQNQGRLQ